MKKKMSRQIALSQVQLWLVAVEEAITQVLTTDLDSKLMIVVDLAFYLLGEG